jgi:uncharacterized protein (DUF58 family)
VAVFRQLSQRLNLRRFFVGEGPQTPPYRLHRRNVYILPTKQGLIFANLLLLMLIGAINYNNNLAYLMTFLLASLSVVGILHNYRNLLRLSLSAGHIEPRFVGETLNIPIRIDNRTGPARLAIELQFPGEDAYVLDIDPHQQQYVELESITTQRGRHLLDRFTIASRFPLGLFRSWANVHLKHIYLVYPRPAAINQLPADSLYKLKVSGDQGVGADDFAGLRQYHSGDSLRHIHWKAAARQQGLLTKQFGGDRSEELWFEWASLPEVNVEQRLSILTRWVLLAEREGKSYGLRLPNLIIEPNRGGPHRHQCLKALAEYETKAEHA